MDEDIRREQLMKQIARMEHEAKVGRGPEVSWWRLLLLVALSKGMYVLVNYLATWATD